MTPCLCAPTSHPGSFRCRFHRAAALTHSTSTTPTKLYPDIAAPAASNLQNITNAPARVMNLCTEGAGRSSTPARHVINIRREFSSPTAPSSAPSVYRPDPPSPASGAAYPASSRSSSVLSSASYTSRVLTTSPLSSRCASAISAHAVAMAILNQHSHESKQNHGLWNQQSSRNLLRRRPCTSSTPKIGPSRLSRMAVA